VCLSGALEQARALAFDHARAAALALRPLSESPARDSLAALALHVASRSA
jgi:hypothetical protein